MSAIEAFYNLTGPDLLKYNVHPTCLQVERKLQNVFMLGSATPEGRVMSGRRVAALPVFASVNGFQDWLPEYPEEIFTTVLVKNPFNDNFLEPDFGARNGIVLAQNTLFVALFPTRDQPTFQVTRPLIRRYQPQLLSYYNSCVNACLL